eukprot:scaffold80607_cov27-Attheya_sp.AAC.3
MYITVVSSTPRFPSCVGLFIGLTRLVLWLGLLLGWTLLFGNTLDFDVVGVPGDEWFGSDPFALSGSHRGGGTTTATTA